MEQEQSGWADKHANDQSELTSVREQLAELQNDFDSTLQQKDDEIEQQQHTISQLQTQLTTQCEQLQSMEEKMLSTLSRFETNETKFDEVKQTLQRQLDEQLDINRHLQQDLRLAFKNHKAELTELKEEYHNEAYKQKYHEMIQENSALRNRITRLSVLIGELESVRQLETRTLNAATSINVAMQHKFSALQRERDELASQQLQLQQEANRCNSILKATQTINESVSVYTDANDEAIAFVFKTLITLHPECSSLFETMHAVRDTYQRLSDNKEMMESMQARIDGFVQTEVTLEQNLSEGQSQMDELRACFDQLQFAHNDLEQERDSLTEQINELQQFQAQLQEALAGEHKHSESQQLRIQVKKTCQPTLFLSFRKVLVQCFVSRRWLLSQISHVLY
jgi:chromosome segregation ATPase